MKQIPSGVNDAPMNVAKLQYKIINYSINQIESINHYCLVTNMLCEEVCCDICDLSADRISYNLLIYTFL